jgi:predicted aspartyl protease
VNGKTGLFLVDTGADRSIVDTAFALRLGLKQTGVANIRTNYSTEVRPTVIAENFQFGSKVFSDVSLVDMDLSLISLMQTVTLAGVLGIDFLTTACVTLQYSSGVVQIATCVDHAGRPIRLMKAGDVFFVPVQIGPSGLQMLLDSGTTLTALSYTAWQGLPISERRYGVMEGIRSSTSSADAGLGCVPTFRIGAVALRQLPLRIVRPTQAGNFSSDLFAGILGSDVLERFRVTLDLGHSTMYLDPDPAYRSDPYEFVTIGIQFYKAETGAFTVVSVWKGAPAEEAGVAVGDQIVSVNGLKSLGLDPDGFSDQLHRPAGTSVTLEIERPTGTSIVRTKTRRLVCESN